MHRDAAEHLSYALRTYAISGSTKEQLAKARQMLAEAKQHVTVVTIAVNVQGAEVLVDGKTVGHAPLPDDVFVEPGPRVIEAKLAGHAGARQTIEATKGGTRNVALALAPAAPAAAATPTTPAAAATPATPATSVASAGSVGPVAPPRGLGAKAGGAEDPRGDGGPNKGVIIAGIATSAATITGGIVFAIASSVKAGEADEGLAALVANDGATPCFMTSPDAACAPIRSSLEAERAFKNLSVWSFVAGGVVGAGTAIYAFSTRAKRTSYVRAVPVVSAHAGGVVITGRW